MTELQDPVPAAKDKIGGYSVEKWREALDTLAKAAEGDSNDAEIEAGHDIASMVENMIESAGVGRSEAPMTATEQTATTRPTWTTARVQAQDLVAEYDTAFLDGKWRLVYEVWTANSEFGPADTLGSDYPGVQAVEEAWQENFTVVVRYRCPTPQDQDDDKLIVLDSFDLVEIQVKAGTIPIFAAS